MAAIGDQYPGDAWIIEGNEVRFNHGQGISFGGRATIRKNKVHHNGQLGIRSTHAKHALVEDNELSYNTVPEIGYTWSHEGGGAKFTVSDSLVIRDNRAHDNWGPGLWTDIENTNTLYEGNTCTNNLASGIFHEISFNAIIRCNTLSGNGKVHGAQILLSTSKNVEVYNNTAVVNKNSGEGIRVVQRDRGAAYSGTNNNVHHNDITYSTPGKTSGAWADYDTDNFWKKGHNRFYDNRYHFPGTVNAATETHWEWNGGKLAWKDFQHAGQDLQGVVDQVNTAKAECR
jgi:parallel beta-helix repeat protein